VSMSSFCPLSQVFMTISASFDHWFSPLNATCSGLFLTGLLLLGLPLSASAVQAQTDVAVSDPDRNPNPQTRIPNWAQTDVASAVSDSPADVPTPASTDAAASLIHPGDVRPWLEHTPLRIARFGILPEESELYFQLLAYVRDLPPGELKQAAQEFMRERWQNSRHRGRSFQKFPIFEDLYLHPQEYQGRPITLTGHVQRSVVSRAGENEFGIENLIEVWLFTEDSQQHPTVVLTTSLPPDFPTGEQTVDRVTVTGYLFRMYNYKARDQGRYAPLVMAQRLEWLPPEQLGARDYSWIWMIFAGCVLIFVASLLAVYLNARSHSARKRHPMGELPSEIYSAPEDRSEVKLPKHGN